MYSFVLISYAFLCFIFSMFYIILTMILDMETLKALLKGSKHSTHARNVP